MVAVLNHASRSFPAAVAPLVLLPIAGLLGCATPMLSVDDAVVRRGSETRLCAFVGWEPVLFVQKDAEGARVRFLVEGQEPSEKKTDDDGLATLECKLPPDVAQYEARTRANGHELDATGRVFVWDEPRVIIAVDVDHTIEQTDYKPLFFSSRADESDPVKRSAKTLSALADDFYVIYLTARPRFLLDRTRVWLHEHEFPDGPVVTAKRIRQMLQPAEFKRQELHELHKDWPTLLIGIGNRPTDADAYGASEMLTLILSPKEAQEFPPHALVFHDWAAVQRFFEANHDTLTDSKALKQVIAGKRMLARPVETYQKR
jgi:hypothetical protein